MKYALTIILISVASSAYAQSQYVPAQNMQMQTCFKQIPALAAKLGVAPHSAGYESTIVVNGCNGKSYDLVQLLNALVDRMDKTARAK